MALGSTRIYRRVTVAGLPVSLPFSSADDIEDISWGHGGSCMLIKWISWPLVWAVPYFVGITKWRQSWKPCYFWDQGYLFISPIAPCMELHALAHPVIFFQLFIIRAKLIGESWVISHGKGMGKGICKQQELILFLSCLWCSVVIQPTPIYLLSS